MQYAWSLPMPFSFHLPLRADGRAFFFLNNSLEAWGLALAVMVLAGAAMLFLRHYVLRHVAANAQGRDPYRRLLRDHAVAYLFTKDFEHWLQTETDGLFLHGGLGASYSVAYASRIRWPHLNEAPNVNY